MHMKWSEKRKGKYELLFFFFSSTFSAHKNIHDMRVYCLKHTCVWLCVSMYACVCVLCVLYGHNARKRFVWVLGIFFVFISFSLFRANQSKNAKKCMTSYFFMKNILVKKNSHHLMLDVKFFENFFFWTTVCHRAYSFHWMDFNAFVCIWIFVFRSEKKRAKQKRIFNAIQRIIILCGKCWRDKSYGGILVKTRGKVNTTFNGL